MDEEPRAERWKATAAANRAAAAYRTNREAIEPFARLLAAALALAALVRRRWPAPAATRAGKGNRP
jgi:uncharacterized MAPEG superfamily protein